MRDKVLEMEYVFCDTGEELQETYEYLERIEAHLGKPVTRLNPERPFRHYLENACPLEKTCAAKPLRPAGFRGTLHAF